MKKGIRFSLIFCVLMISLLFVFSGCGNNEQEDTVDTQSIDIALSIDFPQTSKIVDISGVAFRIEEDTSVLQTIELYGNVNNISVLVDTTHGTLEGIRGIINDVHQKNHTWKFKINGKYVSAAISECILKDGDKLEFIYVKK